MTPAVRARGVACLAVALFLAAGLAPMATATDERPLTTLAVLGETHGTRTITQTLVDHAAAKGATGCVCPGDFIYGDSASSPALWRAMMKPFMGQMLPAQGNHDHPWSDWKSIFPGEQRYYSTDVEGVQFIALNPEYSSLSAGSTQRVWLESALGERDPSALKVVFVHRPWWLPDGARHPESSFAAKAGTSGATMDSLMRAHGVDLVVAGHEKSYQHSFRDGVRYLVQGSTGPEWDKYPLGYELEGAVKRLSTPVGSVLHIHSNSMTIESYDKTGGFVETFTMNGGASTPPPSDAADVQFRPYDGSEWWVQTKLAGADAARVAKVEARDDNTPWRILTVRSWGAYAESFRVESGHTVTFRATLTDGRVVTSCKYAHPSATCVSSGGGSGSTTEPSADVTFLPSGGNEWWVQTKLGGADDSRVVKVEARDVDPTWYALTYRAWGAWAASFHVDAGSAVTYRATLSDGRVVTSCAFTHATGACAGGGAPAQPAYAADFRNARGNEWWVEVDVTAAALQSVHARVDGGTWEPLAKRSWGSWAASMRAPPGSSIEFRATATDGRTATSAAFAWS